MRRIALSLFGASLALGLTFACEKKPPDAGKAEAGAKQADEGGEKADEGGEEADEGADETGADTGADETGADEAAEAVEDDTKGLGAIVRELAGDEGEAEADTAGKDGYDVSKDAGGLIGHVAAGLAHDDELADSKTRAELVILAGEKDKAPTDGEICGHVWTEVFAKVYADKADAEDDFKKACKHEIEKQRVKLGIEIFAEHATCVLGASDLAAVDVCDALEQAAEDALHEDPHGDQPEAKLCTAAVEHMFILVSRDMIDNPDLLEILNEDIDVIKADAKLACRDEGTKAELQCVMKAAALKDLEGCVVKPEE